MYQKIAVFSVSGSYHPKKHRYFQSFGIPPTPLHPPRKGEVPGHDLQT